MKVAELAHTLAVTPETVRYYSRKGLLTPKRDPENGYQEFSEYDRRRLQFIVNARHLGFSLADIETILNKADSGETPCPTVRHLIEQRLAETEARFLEIQALRDRMREALESWDAQPDQLPCGHSICHLIESINDIEPIEEE